MVGKRYPRPTNGAALVEEMGAVASQEAIPSGLTIITATLWELCGLTAHAD